MQKKKIAGEPGFTLIELLVVVVILGILAAVVVFAVSGISDRGKNSACQSDAKTLEVAEEATYAKNSAYTDEATLVTNGFLKKESTLHNITLNGGNYTVVTDSDCPAP